MAVLNNKRVAALFLELLFANRTDEALAILSKDVTWRVMGDPSKLRVAGVKDRAKTERLLRGTAGVVPGGMRMEIHGLTAEEDRVAAEAEAWATWSNGKPYHNQYHFLFRFHDGLICEVREYMDTLQVFRTLEA